MTFVAIALILFVVVTAAYVVFRGEESEPDRFAQILPQPDRHDCL